MMRRGQNNGTNNTRTAFQKMVEEKMAKSTIVPSFNYYKAKKYLNEDLIAELATTRDYESQLVLKKQLAAMCDIFGVSLKAYQNKAQAAALAKTDVTCPLENIGELRTLLMYQREDEIDDESVKLIDSMVSDIDFVLSIAADPVE